MGVGDSSWKVRVVPGSEFVRTCPKVFFFYYFCFSEVVMGVRRASRNSDFPNQELGVGDGSWGLLLEGKSCSWESRVIMGVERPSRYN